MQSPQQIKAFIAEKIKEKNLSLNEVSLAIGRNGTYLFQFINRDSPKRLGEMERKKLARILEVEEQQLTDIIIENVPMKLSKGSISIDIISATPCCGAGSDISQADEVIGKWIMPEKDFRELTFSQPENIKQMRVVGDSMSPTIKDGDYILADTSFNYFEIDGIYLIRMLNGLAVKRLQAGLNDVKIISDNKRYEPITANAGEIHIIGKVIKIMNIENV